MADTTSFEFSMSTPGGPGAPDDGTATPEGQTPGGEAAKVAGQAPGAEAAKPEGEVSGTKAAKPEGKVPATKATKPRRRAPAKPRQSKTKGAGKSDGQESPGRFDRADQHRPDPSVTVDANELLAQVGQLTEQLVRTRIALETATAERDALVAELEAEREKRSHADRRAQTSEAARVEAEENLSREREAAVELNTDLEDAQRRAEDYKNQLNLTWNQLQAAYVPPAEPDDDWRPWRRWR